jgi:hypothetical protein
MRLYAETMDTAMMNNSLILLSIVNRWLMIMFVDGKS